jgi:hypothetical protein
LLFDISLWFWFEFPWLVVLHIFSYTCWSLICFLLRNVYFNLLLIFNWVIWFWYWVFRVHYPSWMWTPRQMHTLQTFSPLLYIVSALCWVFPWLCRSFFILWNQFPFAYFAFVSRASGVLPIAMSWSVSPRFYSRTFIVSGLNLHPIHFELIL